MRIAFVTQPGQSVLPALGSIEIVTEHVARRLAHHHSVTILASASPQQHQRREVREGITYSFVPHTGAKLLRLVRPLWRLRDPRKPSFASIFFPLGYWIGVAVRARRERADVIWIFNYSQGVPLIRLFNRKATVILNMRCGWLSQLDHRMIERRLARLDLVVGCSDAITEAIAYRFPQFADCCATAYNGADVDVLSKVPVARTGKENTIRILYVGRISPEKGVHVLLEAFATVCRRDPRVTLTLVGGDWVVPRYMLVGLAEDEETRALARFYPGDYSQALRASPSAEVAARITRTGNVLHAETVEHYRQSDIFVFPSIWEAFGNPVVEAMAAGLPVVATRVGGIVEIVEDGLTGFLVPPADPDALAQGILSLVEDRTLRERMGAAGRGRAARLFSYEAVAAAYQQCIERAAGDPAVARS